MTILEHLVQESGDQATDELSSFCRALADLGDSVSKQAEAHLKQVIAQHPGFDLHDSGHSSSVEKNIRFLLGKEGLKTRSVTELFLLHLAAYLHDCAMALPQWELNLLKITEGVGKEGDNSPAGIKNDLKPALGFDAARSLILSQPDKIFGGGGIPLNWLFSPRTEKELVSDLAERLRAYQVFRSGYASELRELQSNDAAYAQRSEDLRQEFIRQTHATRIESWIRNLEKMFEERLSGAWGKALAHDLALICRSHGEGGDFVRTLQTETAYFGGLRSNLQFMAVLLRVADIVDFSSARAPIILYREKMITSQISRDHWEVKNEGISYAFGKTASGAVSVRYSAYFQNPKLYFLFQEYLDWVDYELILYNQVVDSKRATSDYFTALPPVESKVDRCGIRYDSNRFTPVFGLQFSLDQRRVLELLMGVKLYKEPFACIRELYQNALDATRCMLAFEGKAAMGEIEFGLQEDASGMYLSCRDNGVGMTKEIVSRFLLKVGNSYYRSKDYQRLAASWSDVFTPTSQFGVGILSCFMIGTRMEIITKPLPGLHDDADAICFVIDGPHEHFYYKPVEPSEREMVGKHGTIVKLYLSEIYRKKLHSSPLSNVAFWQHAAGFLRNNDILKAELDAWDAHLYKAISEFVGDYPSQISVTVKSSNGANIPLLRATTPFDYVALEIPRAMIEAWENENYWCRTDRPRYLSVFNDLIHKTISVTHLGATFTALVSFPKLGFPIKDHRALDVVHLMKRNGLMVDGICIGNNIHSGKDTIDSLARVGILNFSGRQRPPLSVDRLSVVEWPKELAEIAEELANQAAIALLDEAMKHAREFALAPDSGEIQLLWDCIFTRFNFLTRALIDGLIKTHEANYVDVELSVVAGRAISMSGLAQAEELTLKWVAFRKLKERSKRVLSAKLAAATNLVVADATALLKGSDFFPLSRGGSMARVRDWTLVYRADEWTGAFQEFDWVSAVWPILPARLHDKIDVFNGRSRAINPRVKILHHFSNNISGIGDLDPATIHQRLGVYRVKKDSILDSEPESLIYRFEEAANDFWFGELGDRDQPENKNRWVVHAYIGPRELSPKEAEDIKRYLADDPDYVRGVTEGWSILFLGQKDTNTICLPGIVSRKRMVEMIPTSFWSAHSDLSFFFLDGERLTASSKA